MAKTVKETTQVLITLNEGELDFNLFIRDVNGELQEYRAKEGHIMKFICQMESLGSNPRADSVIKIEEAKQ